MGRNSTVSCVNHFCIGHEKGNTCYYSGKAIGCPERNKTDVKLVDRFTCRYIQRVPLSKLKAHLQFIRNGDQTTKIVFRNDNIVIRKELKRRRECSKK